MVCRFSRMNGTCTFTDNKRLYPKGCDPSGKVGDRGKCVVQHLENPGLECDLYEYDARRSSVYVQSE